jgi:hypothetical protein
MNNTYLTRSTLESLRWKEDMLVTNHFGERVFLTAAYNDDGERIGITDCCLAEAPCDKHGSYFGDSP